MSQSADLELQLRRNGGDLIAELRFTPAGSSAPVTLLAGALPLVALDEAALRAQSLDPLAYGEQLSAMLWADQRLAQAVAQARALAEGAGTALRLRLLLDEGDPALHGLHWETLGDPTSPARPLLAVSERLRFSRFLGSSDLQPLRPRPRANLRALVVIANPEDLDAYQLDLIDGAAELARARSALGEVPTTLLAGPNHGGPATLNNIIQALRDGPDILYLVAHGSLHRATPYLWLEDDEGLAARVSAKSLVEQIQSLSQRPLLVVLASCQSAGNGATVGALNALGPQLAAAGIAAVVAMQGNVAQAAISRFMPIFFTELLRDGAVDRATAAGRAALVASEEWWQPVLWMRVTDGQLWFEPQSQPAAPEAVPAEHPTNLPTYPTPLIGRDNDLAALVGIFFQEHVRLVTLLGPGGIGKTRLAVAAAWELKAEFSDGAFFVDLTSLHSEEQLLTALAGVLDLKEEPNRPLQETILSYLRPRKLLLVLDTFEHLLNATALVGKLLASAPDLRLIITSRAALRIGGEYEYPVEALPPPDLQRMPLRASERVASLAANPAVALFLERASAVKPGFALNEANAHLIAKICVQLDGLPLALELAAVRMKLLAPQALLARLSNRLGLLTGGARDKALHQQTLRDTIGWSYDLLTPEEQRLFARLSIFAGGVSFTAVEHICGAFDPAGDLLDLLSSLVDKSLLAQQNSDDDEPRFRMLATIREFASERFISHPSEEQHALYLAYADYYLELAATARKGIQGPTQKAVLQQFEREHDNLRAALEWAINAADAQRAGSLGDMLYSFWYLRGYYSEGRQWLEKILVLGEAVPAAERSQVQYGLGLLSMAQGNYSDAQFQFEAAKAGYQHLGNQQRVLGALQNLGIVARFQGKYAEAQAYYEECLHLLRASGGGGLFAALMNMASVLYDQGHLDQASGYLEEALVIAQAEGRVREIALANNNRGLIALRNGDQATAMELFSLSLRSYREQQNQAGIAMVLNSLGHAYLEGEQLDQAASHFAESLQLRSTMGDMRGVAASLEGCVMLALKRGEDLRAAQLWGAAEALRTRLKAPLAPLEQPAYDNALTTLREALGTAQFSAALATGAALPIEAAVTLATG